MANNTTPQNNEIPYIDVLEFIGKQSNDPQETGAAILDMKQIVEHLEEKYGLTCALEHDTYKTNKTVYMEQKYDNNRYLYFYTPLRINEDEDPSQLYEIVINVELDLGNKPCYQLSMKKEGEEYPYYPDDNEHKYIKNLGNNSEYEQRIGEAIEMLLEQIDVFFKIKDLIDNGARQIILNGAPGTGKTRAAIQIAEGDEKGGKLKNGKKYEFVQFHPSYDYTDFVEGLRPVEGVRGGLKFAKLDGIFKKFCREVVENSKQKENKDKLYFFIIDEINRADLSKVFGELMFCLEKDKRVDLYDNEKWDKCTPIKTQYYNLKTYGIEPEDDCFVCDTETKKDFEQKKMDGFYIPENVVIIGTMNDIDRSVESMDFALRRRFEFVEFKVNPAMLKNAFEAVEDNKPVYGAFIKSAADYIANRVMAVNNVISGDTGKAFGLDEHYYISQGQFANLPDNIKNGNDINRVLNYVWKYRIESLLKEYVRGEDKESVQEFIDECRTAFIEG